MTKHCEPIRTLIEQGAWIDPTADGFDEVAEHVATCADCAREIRELRRAERMMREGLEWADPGVGFADRVLAATGRRGRFPRGLVRLGTAAGVVLAAVGASLLTLHLSTPPASVVSDAPGGDRLAVARISGDLHLEDATPVEGELPVGQPIIAGPGAAFEVVDGLGLALREESRFRVAGTSTPGQTNVHLDRGRAAVSVKTRDGRAAVEVRLNDLAVLTNNADFLVETKGAGGVPALYVDRGSVVVKYEGGMSAVAQGQQVALTSDGLARHLGRKVTKISTELTALERECAGLEAEIARYEANIDTFTERWEERNTELEMTREAIALAPDEETSIQLERRISRQVAGMEKLDFVMGESIAKMSALRQELQRRLGELRRKREIVRRQQAECRRALARLNRTE
ncbi:MAG: hypothetical protein R6V58_06905 [Planctomycetota bacterium]